MHALPVSSAFSVKGSVRRAALLALETRSHSVSPFSAPAPEAMRGDQGTSTGSRLCLLCTMTSVRWRKSVNGGMTQEPVAPVQAAPDQSRDIIASAQCILDRENFVRELDRYLKHSDFLDLRKTELLYKKYLENVSEPLMQKMKNKMDSQLEKEVWKRRQEQFSQYLNYCTKKGYVFLDDYDPSEYDPFFQKTCTDCWKV
uniref:protein FAM228B n=1 Tax=Agelaius phoeniceus TaxID=39638 RepID=UPI0023ED6854|nr:protein FAM228B [Agelaius phoeniceus]